MSWKTNGHFEVCTCEAATNSMPRRSRRRTFLKQCCQFFGGSVSPPLDGNSFASSFEKKAGLRHEVVQLVDAW